MTVESLGTLDLLAIAYILANQIEFAVAKMLVASFLKTGRVVVSVISSYR